MLRSIKINEFILEGSEMKMSRFLVLLALAIGLLAGPWQAPAEAEMLGSVGQIKTMYYSEGNWYQKKPDGTSSLFTLAAGQSFVMTEIRARFYVSDTTTQTGPYRLNLVGPNSTKLYTANLTDFKYPGSNTVSGGVVSEMNLNPGYVFIAPPTPEVRQMPPPPANPNSGDIRTGTFHMTVRGYVVP
jgi:hypothetical protein